MHWLLILSLLSSTTSLQPGTSGSSMNGLAENALRQQLGGANVVRVNITPEAGNRMGDFRSMNVTLDGFSADRLMGLADRAQSSGNIPASNNPPYNPPYSYPSGNSTNYVRPNQFDLGDIFTGGGIFGDILGGVLGGTTSQGRLGSLVLNASNFTYQGVRYDSMAFNLGEIKFDWTKALRGDFDVQSVRPGSLRLNLRADQAERLVAPRLPSVRDVRMSFRNGTAFVGGRTDVYGVNIPFEVGGRLSVQANEVHADDIRLSVARLRLPSFVVNELTRSVNPLYDFDPNDRWPMMVNLGAADGGNNVLAMQGGLQWVGFNRNRQSTPAPTPAPPTRNEPDFGDIFGGIFGR